VPVTQKIRVYSSNRADLLRAVSEVYCPHTAAFRSTRAAPPARFEVIRPGMQPVAELRYGMPAKVDAGKFPRLMLMQSCLEGTGTACQENVTADCRSGQTLPLSPGRSTQLEFDARFAQRSVRLDVERVEALCSRMVSHPLDAPLRFELRPFSNQLEKAWSHAVGLVMTYDDMNVTLPPAAVTSFDEFLISLVLTQHPHNYTDELHTRARSTPPRLIREAEHLMRTGEIGLTIGEIASRLGVSLRSLEAGFREYRRMTPTQSLRTIRLQRARAGLLAPTASTSVTTVALENGFLHLPRFSGYYRAAFGESPAVTLRRSRGNNG
jgi:AraC-like DNA-binding protein